MRRTGRATRTLPIAPLIAYLKSIGEDRDSEVVAAQRRVPDRPSAKHLADVLGVDSRTICRIYERGGLLTLWEADRYATRLGRHPIEIWGDAYLAAPDGTPPHPQKSAKRNKRLICEACGTVFYAVNSTARTGTKVCDNRMRNLRERGKA